jgi:tRNA pseudouridine38-40 synthase
LSIVTSSCVACSKHRAKLHFRPVSRTFLAKLQYDGTGFVGWQRQPTGRSVQAEFERVLERLFSRPTVASAAGRTDAGVHAVGQGVSFSAPLSWTPTDMHRALNALLPQDCWVESVDSMQPGFHARKSAISRRYRYDLGLDAGAASPFRRRFEWALARPLDGHLLQLSARQIQGEHDFTAFAVKGNKPHHRCRLMLSEWTFTPDDRRVSFHVEADRFLHHMVRMLVGTMVEIALGRRAPGDLRELLLRGDNQQTSAPAPSQGLYFVAASYPPDLFLTHSEAHAAAHLA